MSSVDYIGEAGLNAVLTLLKAEINTDAQVQTAVNNYLDENSIVFNTSAEITEVLNGN